MKRNQRFLDLIGIESFQPQFLNLSCLIMDSVPLNPMSPHRFQFLSLPLETETHTKINIMKETKKFDFYQECNTLCK